MNLFIGREILTITALVYNPPVLVNFLDDFKGTPSLSSSIAWRQKREGTFVLTALEDNIKFEHAIRVYAAADSASHGGIWEYCRERGISVRGKVLGGGSIRINDEKTAVSTWGHSMDFGGLPDKVLIAYFSACGFSITSEMAAGYTKESTEAWFRDHEML